MREGHRADLAALGAVKAETAALARAHDDLKWEHEVLTQRSLALAAERDAVVDKFGRAVHAVQRRAGLALLAAERSLAQLDPQQLALGDREDAGGAAAEAVVGVGGGVPRGDEQLRVGGAGVKLAVAALRGGLDLNATAATASSGEDPPQDGGH